MRALLILGVVGFGLWYVFVGGKVDEPDVRELYTAYWDAFMAGDSEALCDLFDENFQAHVRTTTPAGSVEETADVAATCEGAEKFHAMKEAMEEKAGVELFMNTEFTVESITVDPDGKAATARMSSELRVGTESRLFLRMRATQTDRIVGHFGGAKFLSSEGTLSF